MWWAREGGNDDVWYLSSLHIISCVNHQPINPLQTSLRMAICLRGVCTSLRMAPCLLAWCARTSLASMHHHTALQRLRARVRSSSSTRRGAGTARSSSRCGTSSATFTRRKTILWLDRSTAQHQVGAGGGGARVLKCSRAAPATLPPPPPLHLRTHPLALRMHPAGLSSCLWIRSGVVDAFIPPR